MPDYPNNAQISLHFKEFLLSGYRLSAEAVMTKFPWADGSRELRPFSVGCVDGFTKIIIMLALVGVIEELEISDEALQSCPVLLKALKSFRYVRCSYEHEENPANHFLHSLRNLTANMTADAAMQVPEELATLPRRSRPPRQFPSWPTSVQPLKWRGDSAGAGAP